MRKHQLGCVPVHVLPTRLLLCCVPWRNEAVTSWGVLVWQPRVRGCALCSCWWAWCSWLCSEQLGGLWGWAICMPLVWKAGLAPMDPWGVRAVQPLLTQPEMLMGRQLYWTCWYQRELLAFAGAWRFQTMCMAVYLSSGVAAAMARDTTKILSG